MSRPPRVLAGREIRAGERGVVAAGPAAERDLQRSTTSADDQRRSAQLARGVRERPVAPVGSAHASHASSDSVARPPSRCSTTISGLSSRSRSTCRAGPAGSRARPARSAATGCCGSRRFAIARPRARGSAARARGEVAVHHLLDGLVILERPVRERFVDRVDVLERRSSTREVAVAAGPVRTAEAGVRSGAPRRRARRRRRRARRPPAPGAGRDGNAESRVVVRLNGAGGVLRGEHAHRGQRGAHHDEDRHDRPEDFGERVRPSAGARGGTSRSNGS